MVTVSVFTHPVCATCPNAIRLGREVAGARDDVTLRIVSLATDQGRAEAREAQVLSVPTVLVGQQEGVRFVGVPGRRELIAAIENKSRRGDIT